MRIDKDTILKVAYKTDELLNPRDKYYSGTKLLEAILNDEKEDMCKYMMSYSEKSAGKTTWWFVFCVVITYMTGRPTCLLRRWEEAFKSNRPTQYFSSINNMGIIEELTEGKWNTITYYRKGFYFSRYDEEKDKNVKSTTPIMYCRSLTTYENDNGTQIDKCAWVMFDEFIPRGGELPDEVEKYFKPCISSIKRNNDDTRIVLLGNPINRFSSYFEAFGLDGATEMAKGTIRIYEYPSGLRMAVERGGELSSKKDNELYYSFGDLLRDSMVTGDFETIRYPRPEKYDMRNMLADFYIIYKGNCYRGVIIYDDNSRMVLFYPFDKNNVNYDEDIIYTEEYNNKANYRRNILSCSDKLSKEILNLMKLDLARFSDNRAGATVDGYLKWCQGNKGAIYDKV